MIAHVPRESPVPVGCWPTRK